MIFIPNREDLAWAAGFWDGEGHVSWTSRRVRGNGALYHQIQAAVSQSGRDGVPEVLVRFQRAVGRGAINGPYQYGQMKMPAWRWCAGGNENTQFVFALLWNWLGPVKRDQARRALLGYRSEPKMAGGPKRVAA